MTRAPSVDTDPHPHFRVYSAGNFAEVAPQRLSPMSWSLVGDPMERGTRELARRLWGRGSWAEGSHFVFVGYFGCRPYHNLAAYCQLARNIPGLDPRDVTKAYFEGIEPPPGQGAVRVPGHRRAGGAGRLLRELAAVGPALRDLEERVAELEWQARAAFTLDSPVALAGVLHRARPVVEDAWQLHILTTSSLVPLTAVQRSVYDRLMRHGADVAHWVTRPRELVWDRLHLSARTLDDHAPGSFLDSSFYEVADSADPWRSYAVRHQRAVMGAAAPVTSVIAVAEAVEGMLVPWRGRVVRALAVTVGEMMAAREHSKSLAMRTLHVYRRLLPRLSCIMGLDEDAWPYLTVREFTDALVDPGLLARAGPRRVACRHALEVAMPDHLDLTDGDGQFRPWVPTASVVQRGVAPGIGVGAVIYPDDEPEVEGAVIVCASADADIAPLMPFAEAVLSERGSELSHVAILAREYGIPCVVGYPGAASLPTGTVVSVNGTTGEVRILDQ